ncbi:hypothetical protein BLA50215_07498 [Burkholderia lata]|uniref:hypothetical protein n=1 Tax=Burkholderia lata (strain ATCC 17760 / DSM 23089 / LMG 22485 / NCIMB 9086 / R18194 / 383) TaxID=482957 RepID=UPI001454247E|nr:hypothetical protein [Burkholderia lata]VWD61912.1 hypothetical protein BLA50215_07498 [Burkholderia lata]
MLGLKRRPHIEEVVFADDFFRTSENGLSPASRSNRKFLRAFFGTAASRLGWGVREVCPQSQGGSITVPKLMEALGLPQSPQGWAAACTADLSRSAEHLRALALDLTPATLVIGWGLPPSVMHFVDSHGAAFIDVEIHSIRFTRDLHLAMRTNDAGIQSELERLRIDEEVFWSAAAGLRAQFARRGQSSIVRPDLSVGLFLGQMDVDLALVCGGRLARPVDFITQITEWAQQVDLLAIRPHPAQNDSRHLHALLESAPNVVLVGCNTYSLLCADNLAFVGAVSSGTLKEAGYLGCNDIRQLLTDDRNNASLLPATCSPWIPVRLEVASPRSLLAFSRARKSAWHWPVPRLSTNRPSAFPEDMLNHIFAYRWGLDLSAGGLPEVPTLVLGQSLSLASDTPGAACAAFGRGWHAPEHWGVWSAEARACFVVSLDCPADVAPGRGFEVSLHGHAYAPGAVTPPIIRVVVNGRECQVHSGPDGGFEWVVQLDADAIEYPLLVISIDVQGALRPCDVGGNPNDVRTFGIGLRYVTFREGRDAGREAVRPDEVSEVDQEQPARLE